MGVNCTHSNKKLPNEWQRSESQAVHSGATIMWSLIKWKKKTPQRFYFIFFTFLPS